MTNSCAECSPLRAVALVPNVDVLAVAGFPDEASISSDSGICVSTSYLDVGRAPDVAPLSQTKLPRSRCQSALLWGMPGGRSWSLWLQRQRPCILCRQCLPSTSRSIIVFILRPVRPPISQGSHPCCHLSCNTLSISLRRTIDEMLARTISALMRVPGLNHCVDLLVGSLNRSNPIANDSRDMMSFGHFFALRSLAQSCARIANCKNTYSSKPLAICNPLTCCNLPA